ncbi:hypothetical protein HYV81_00675 [Candidatus Woesearchaeota archaeon]|nr:hypothetical protein [Candidatus Woesearchaeota archaeon]
MNIIIKGILGLIVLVLFLPLFLSSASAQEFVNIESHVSAIYQRQCQCQSAYYRFYLRNPGDRAEIYDFFIKGKMAPYAKSNVPSPIVLMPGQDISFKLIIQVPCKALGTENLDFAIKTGHGLEAFYPLTYDIISCPPYEFGYSIIEAQNIKKEIPAGIPARIEVEGKPNARTILEWFAVLLVLGAIGIALFYALTSYYRRNGGKEDGKNEEPAATAETYY